MEDGDESAAVAEAVLGLNLQLFVNEVHGIIADISAEAFEYCLQAAAAPGVLGAAKAAEKATDLQRDNSCAKESHKDGTSDSDLDLELDSLRRKLESANKESEKILKERCHHWKGKLRTKENLILLSLRYKSCLKTSSCSNLKGLVKAIPVLQQKIIDMNKKRTEVKCLVGQQVCNKTV